jgi:hypothetical protein
MMVGMKPEPCLAQTSHWARYGPIGGSILTVAVDPRSPNTIYADAGLGMFKSTDECGRAYEATGTFMKESQGRHFLYVDVDGATSNDVSIRVSDCSSK